MGVSKEVIEKHVEKLVSMGHIFVAYEKNVDSKVQAERSRDADVIMFANMPLDVLYLRITEVRLPILRLMNRYRWRNC